MVGNHDASHAVALPAPLRAGMLCDIDTHQKNCGVPAHASQGRAPSSRAASNLNATTTFCSATSKIPAVAARPRAGPQRKFSVKHTRGARRATSPNGVAVQVQTRGAGAHAKQRARSPSGSSSLARAAQQPPATSPLRACAAPQASAPCVKQARRAARRSDDNQREEEEG